ncbi:MAG TPA: Rpn family recombination-promoting nuclease/putative transposase, partial [Puia sp.]
GPYSGAAGRQVSQYDKILRENMEAFLPGVIKNLLDIHVIYTEELPDDVQHTKERKPDVLKKVTDNGGDTFVLHIEFQSTDEPEMVFRMAEYYIMLLRRYRIPVQQYVIYLGEDIPRMSNRIAAERMQFDYRLITLSAIDYQLFLRAESPEEKMLGILANFRDHDRLEAVAGIVKEVFMASDGDLSRERYLFQLRILGNLRNLQSEINTIMESVAKWWKLERDPFYWKGEQVGMKKGEEKKTLEVVKSLLLNTNHTIPEIANLVNVPESFVFEVKTSLQS